ncbi:LysR substrate-binding domain-containing protein [Xylophilus sp. GW821-FHT01B05]
MPTHLPSTTALRVFESAARHGSCTLAAEELYLTQSAVSKKLRSLEEILGAALFVRINRGLVLTEAGRCYLDAIRPILGQLAEASARVAELRSRPLQQTLVLRLLPILGDRWLLPRFASFAAQHPDIEVQFTSLVPGDEQAPIRSDGEFRYGAGGWPHWQADYLFGREMVAVLAPALLRTMPRFERVEDAWQLPLLLHFQVPHAWTEWHTAFGLQAPAPTRTTRYEFYSTLLRAAVSGMGLALVPRALVQDELASGVLVEPFPSEFHSRQGYYFAVQEQREPSPALAAFRVWLQLQAEAPPPAPSAQPQPLAT